MGRVMVVDDEPEMRLAVRLILERCGHTVEEAASGEDACQRVQGAPPDLLLMDVRMPGQDGLETLGKIRETNKSLPVIIMTGYGNPETEREAFRKGANHYILKPFKNEDLIEAMFQVGVVESPVGAKARADPVPGKQTRAHSSLLPRAFPMFLRFWNVLRQAKAIFIDRWDNPPILFERDPSLEERISLRLSVIMDPIKVIYHGLLDRDFEFSMEEPVEEPPEEPSRAPDALREPLEVVYPEPVRVAPPAPMQTEPPSAHPEPSGPDVEKIQKDLSQQIQSVAQTLQAEIGRLAEQIREQKELPETPEAPSPAPPQGARESPQEEFHRLLIGLQSSWGRELSGFEKELSVKEELLRRWSQTLPGLRIPPE